MMLFVILFILSCFLLLYENYCVVMGRHNIPSLWLSPLSRTAFRFIRRIMAYGSMIGIGYSIGFGWAIGIFLTYIVYGNLTLQHFHNREVFARASYYIKKEKGELQNEGTKIDDEQLKKEAFDFANDVVRRTLDSYGVKTILEKVDYRHYYS